MDTSTGETFAALPGADLVNKGSADLEHGIESAESLLVSIGAARLSRLGLRPPTALPSPEHRLYEMLAAENPDSAHSRYKRARSPARQLRARGGMRELADEERIRQFMRTLGRAADADGACYLAGGATAVLFGWRQSTIAFRRSTRARSD